MKPAMLAIGMSWGLLCGATALAQTAQNPPPSPIPNDSANSATNTDATSGKTVPPAQPSPPADTRKQSETQHSPMKDRADAQHQDTPTR
jgi:hypothetical protein